jgi:hypothetical protein
MRLVDVGSYPSCPWDEGLCLRAFVPHYGLELSPVSCFGPMLSMTKLQDPLSPQLYWSQFYALTSAPSAIAETKGCKSCILLSAVPMQNMCVRTLTV